MTVHELKTLPDYFGPVVDGIKTFEIRKDDRGYQVGDLLFLKEYKEGSYTDHAVVKEVTYTTAFNQEPGYLVLGIKNPDIDTLESHFGYDKAALLYQGYEPIWIIEQATEEDIEESLNAISPSDCC